MSLFSVDAAAGQSVSGQKYNKSPIPDSLQASLSDFSKINGLVLTKTAIVPVVQMVEVIRLIPTHIEIAYFQSDAQGYDLRVVS
jgi:hypothetical protein